jgi:hypothetical protein
MSPDDLHRRQKDDEALRRSTGRSLRAISRIRTIDERAGAIARETRAAQARTLVAQMDEERTGILTRLSTCAAPSSGRWHAHLSGIDLTSASAPSELSDLCDTISRARALWAVTPSPGPARESPWDDLSDGRSPAVVPPLSPQGEGRPRMRVARECSFPDVFRRVAEQQQALDQWQRDVALELELIVSSLHVLMSLRGSYAALTR